MFSPARVLQSATRTRPTPLVTQCIPPRRYFHSTKLVRDDDPTVNQDGVSEARDNPKQTYSSSSSAGPNWTGHRNPERILDSNAFIRPIELNRNYERPKNQQKPRIPSSAEARYNDPFRQLKIDPRRECMNRVLLSAFLTDMGKIQPREVTKLTSRSQRLLAKAIRRARVMGIIPRFSKYHDVRRNRSQSDEY